jgi:hypothetical protein
MLSAGTCSHGRLTTKERLERKEPAYNISHHFLPVHIRIGEEQKAKGYLNALHCPALSYHSYKDVYTSSFLFLACGPPVFFRRPPSSPMLMSFPKIETSPNVHSYIFFLPQADTFEPPGQEREQDSVRPNYTPVYLCSQSKTSSVSGPPVVAEDFSATHLAFAKVLGDAAAHLGEGGAHDFAEVSL